MPTIPPLTPSTRHSAPAPWQARTPRQAGRATPTCWLGWHHRRHHGSILQRPGPAGFSLEVGIPPVSEGGGKDRAVGEGCILVGDFCCSSEGSRGCQTSSPDLGGLRTAAHASPKRQASGGPGQLWAHARSWVSLPNLIGRVYLVTQEAHVPGVWSAMVVSYTH